MACAAVRIRLPPRPCTTMSPPTTMLRIPFRCRHSRAFCVEIITLAALSFPGPTVAAQDSAALLVQHQPVPAWQKAAGGSMTFEVASIHKAEPGPFLPPSFELGVEDTAIPPGGRFFADFALEDYIEFAYKILFTPEQRDALRAKLPLWARTDYFVIQAEAPGNPTKDQMRIMMQNLLADRFHLQVHFETRTEPVFALVLLQRGQPGPRIRPHVQGLPCNAKWVPPPDRTAPSVPPGGFMPECGFMQAIDGPNHTALLGARNATVEQVADYLPWILDFGRPVLDQTGLSGKFDFTLQFTPERRSSPEDSGAAPLDPTGPSLIEALRDQFGMKLQSTRAPVQILVIDHVEPPSPN
jgi:bla regulator protein blaR1